MIDSNSKSMNVGIVMQFESKQGVELQEVVQTPDGELFRFNDHYGYYFHEIKFDIDTNQPVGKISKWHDEQTDAAIEGIVPFQHYRDYCGSEK